MIVISDLSESYIQEITVPEMAVVLGGKLRPKGAIQLNINIAFVLVNQFNLFTNNSSNNLIISIFQ